jgi:repressor LexA
VLENLKSERIFTYYSFYIFKVKTFSPVYNLTYTHMSNNASNRLTERQTQVLDFLKSYQRKHNKPPTFKEIGEALGIRSMNAVFKQINALAEKGYIKRDKGMARGLSITDATQEEDSEVPALPILKNVKSDDIRSLNRYQRFMHVDVELLRRADEDDCIILRADDDGMAKQGIMRNDFLVVQRTKATALGEREVAVIVLQDKTLVRTLTVANDMVYYNSPDRGYTNGSFNLKGTEGLVVGKLISVMRRLS